MSGWGTGAGASNTGVGAGTTSGVDGGVSETERARVLVMRAACSVGEVVAGSGLFCTARYTPPPAIVMALATNIDFAKRDHPTVA